MTFCVSLVCLSAIQPTVGSAGVHSCWIAQSPRVQPRLKLEGPTGHIGTKA